MSSVFRKQFKVNACFRTRSKKVILNPKSTIKISNKGTKFQELLFLDASVYVHSFQGQTIIRTKEPINTLTLYGTTIKYVPPSKPK